MNPGRRRIVFAALAATSLGVPAIAWPAPVVDVYKSASCGCCGLWMEHLRANGFSVRAHDVADPAREVKRLLAGRPAAPGLAVPGMPLGWPGMEGPRTEPYQVLLVDRRGCSSVYAR